MVSINDKAELLGELVDVVEDMLEDRGITLPTPEIDVDEIDENTAIIRGSDYDEMAGGFCKTLENWKLIETEDTQEKKMDNAETADGLVALKEWLEDHKDHIKTLYVDEAIKVLNKAIDALA